MQPRFLFFFFFWRYICSLSLVPTKNITDFIPRLNMSHLELLSPPLVAFPRLKRESATKQLRRDRSHLTLMSIFLGPPPQALLTSSANAALEFFNEDGPPKHKIKVPLDELAARLNVMVCLPMTLSPDDAREFVTFVRRVLVWDQDKRPSAAKLKEDPWVNQYLMSNCPLFCCGISMYCILRLYAARTTIRARTTALLRVAVGEELRGLSSHITGETPGAIV